jgi:hypothetical protein
VELPDELRHDPQASKRWHRLVTALGAPRTQAEREFLTVCCRWLSDDELDALLALARRPVANYHALLQAVAVHIGAGQAEADRVVVSIPEPFARQILQFIPSDDDSMGAARS